MCCVRSAFFALGAVVGPGVRVEVAVAVELEHVPAELVRAGLDDVADHGAGDVADVGRVVVRLHADLGEGVGARLVGDPVVDRLVHVDAVDQEVVRLLAVAVDVGPVRRRPLPGVGEGLRVRRDGARAGAAPAGWRCGRSAGATATVLAESTSPTVADSVWSTGAWAVTSTVSSRAPTSIFRSRRAICLASSVIGRVAVVLKPLSAAFTTYVPTGTDGMV